MEKNFGKRFLRHPDKLMFEASVAFLAMLCRVLIETGLFGPIEISVFLRLIAMHVQTTKQPDISPGSLRAKYDKPSPVQLGLIREWLQLCLKKVDEWEERLYGKDSNQSRK